MTSHNDKHSEAAQLIRALCESAIGLNGAWSRKNAEWLRDLALRPTPSAELSFEEELRAIAKETGKPESVEFVEKLIAAGHTPSHEQPIDIEERIRWHKSEARRLTLESIRGGQSSDIGEISDGNAR
jgi:hypothetical protein